MIISQLSEVQSLHIPPCPDDTSQSMGAVYEYLARKDFSSIGLPMTTPYLGRDANDNTLKSKKNVDNVIEILSKFSNKDDYEIIEKNYLSYAAKELANGKVLGVIWGKEEFGARALGNRSVIANPYNTDIKKRINEMIKDRDFWMPFAASVLESHALEYLELNNEPRAYAYMTNTCNSTKIGSNKLKAALHPYDNTCRPHIVLKGSNLNYEKLIQAFGDETGIYGLLNTSLNLHGFPICSVYDDAIYVMVNSNLDGLVIDGGLILKKD